MMYRRWLAVLTSMASTVCYSFQIPPKKMKGEVTRRQLLVPDREVLGDIAEKLAWPIGGIAAFRIGARIAVIGQPRLPNCNEYIGSRVIRTKESGVRVRLFYPCEKPAQGISNEMAPYCTNGRETSDGMAGLVGFRQLGVSFLLAHLADAQSGCYENANILEDIALPLLVYSHGYGGNMDMATYFLRTMASKGMVVAAIEHTDGTASSTILNDGTHLPFSPSLMSRTSSLNKRADEVIEVSNFVRQQYKTKGLFYGGHSYGCPSAILASARRKEEPLDGLILHDPALGMGYNLLPLSGPDVPTISYTSDEYNRGGVRYGDVTLHVRGAFHGNFVDAPLWAPSWVMRPLSAVIPACGPSDPMRVHDELAVSAKAFMASKSALGEGVNQVDLFELVKQ